MDKIYAHFNGTTTVLLSLSIILFSGFLVTRVTKKLRLPNVSGYIIAGVLIGPYCLRAVPASMITGMGFVNDIALAFIAFGVGKFFKKEVPTDPMKAEYLIPTFIGELLAENKMSVKVLRSNDTWYGMTYKEDVVTVKESFEEMLKTEVYKEDLFSDL